MPVDALSAEEFNVFGKGRAGLGKKGSGGVGFTVGTNTVGFRTLGLSMRSFGPPNAILTPTNSLHRNLPLCCTGTNSVSGGAWRRFPSRSGSLFLLFILLLQGLRVRRS